MGRDVHGFLGGGGVEDEEDLLRPYAVAEPDELLHERFINLQAAGGVEDEHVAIVGLRKLKSLARNLEHVGLAAFDEHRDLELLSERGELVHGRGTINVRGDEQRGAALFVEQ